MVPLPERLEAPHRADMHHVGEQKGSRRAVRSAIFHRMVPGDDSKLSHLRRGALEYCVLSLLVGRERYGLDIARELTTDGVLMSSEGTLYPLLARLRKAGWVSTSWEQSSEGPPRRYYSLTTSGASALEEFRRAWRSFRDAVDAVLIVSGEPT
jgi:PadR family transcriptional regulator PadR